MVDVLMKMMRLAVVQLLKEILTFPLHKSKWSILKRKTHPILIKLSHLLIFPKRMMTMEVVTLNNLIQLMKIVPLVKILLQEPPGHEEPSQQYSERTHYYQKTSAASQVHQRIRPTVIDRNKATNDPPPSRSNEVPTAPWYADLNTFILVLFSMVCIFIVVVVTVYLYFSKTGYITITNNPGANIRAAGNDVNG
ncbi:uncharacterized protein LOC143464462 isoform X2 [Clavelina lepadiformis]|uniref:uncharacterized protein LOC143464462 isoform X2 n=1 Tax=Clavelina lepadiformis TaxID=159417 RepID=UPI0040421015